MKKSISFITFAVIFMIAPALCFGQKTDSTKAEKKISYSFINEYGFYVGGTFGFTGVFVNGIRFNQTQDLLGIGIGYEADSRVGQSIPVYFNYRHYFSGKKAFKPLVNVGIGTRLGLRKEYYYPYDLYDPYYYVYKSKTRITAGLYTTVAAGFKIKALSFTSGIFVKSCEDDFYGGVEVKVGFTF